MTTNRTYAGIPELLHMADKALYQDKFKTDDPKQTARR